MNPLHNSPRSCGRDNFPVGFSRHEATLGNHATHQRDEVEQLSRIPDQPLVRCRTTAKQTRDMQQMSTHAPTCAFKRSSACLFASLRLRAPSSSDRAVWGPVRGTQRAAHGRSADLHFDDLRASPRPCRRYRQTPSARHLVIPHGHASRRTPSHKRTKPV